MNNIITYQTRGTRITKFKLDTKSNDEFVSNVVINLAYEHGYYLHEFKLTDFITAYIICIRYDFDISNCDDIPDEIKIKYKNELRLRKLKQIYNE